MPHHHTAQEGEKIQLPVTRVFYEDVEVGDEIGPLEAQMERRRIVNFVKQAGLDYKRFTDDAHARKEGLGGAIVPGSYSMSLLCRMLTDHFGAGTIVRFGVNYRGLIHHGETVVCRGLVINKTVDGKEHLLECDVSLENQRGEKTIKGNATIRLPARGQVSYYHDHRCEQESQVNR